MDQFVVPLAVPPELPGPVQLTSVTPTLSRAVPVRRIVDDVVDTFPLAGEVIVSEGAVRSGPEPDVE